MTTQDSTPGGRTVTHTVGIGMARRAIMDMIGKYAPDRPWGARAKILPDGGLQIVGDDGYFPVGMWVWQTPASLDPGVLSLTQRPLVTTPALSGASLHTHSVALPTALAPPKAGDEVYVLWMDSNQQFPLVLGPLQYSHDVVTAAPGMLLHAEPTETESQQLRQQLAELRARVETLEARLNA